MNNGLTIAKASNLVIYGACVLAVGLFFATPATADEQKKDQPVEMVVVEEEFATEVIEMEVAGEKAPSATKKTDCDDNLNTTTKDPACSSGGN